VVWAIDAHLSSSEICGAYSQLTSGLSIEEILAPEAPKPQVISGHESSLDNLDERADRIMDDRDISAVSIQNHFDFFGRLNAIEGAILALIVQISVLTASQTQNRFHCSEYRHCSRSRPCSRSGPCAIMTTTIVCIMTAVTEWTRDIAENFILSRRKTKALSLATTHQSHRVFINDVRTGRRFLVDSGAEISVIPPLTAANGTKIRTYGPKYLLLDFGFARTRSLGLLKWPMFLDS
jgi:hypothetical protein